MSSLYLITSEIESICRAEELPPDLEARLDALDLDLREKIDNCCGVLRDKRANALKFRQEAARMIAIADAEDAGADRLQMYVHDNMVRAGMKSIETERFRLRVQACQPSVEVFGDAPPHFARVKTAWEWDKKAVLVSWKAGEPLPDGVRVTQGTSLRGVS